MAAVIAITLYMELPRVAMQAQRDKEQQLIDTGEQYKRAIQLFFAKAKRYPGDIKELESFQNQRFLRRRFKDPMTGKEEWRLVHIQNGILTDSKVTKPNAPGADKQTSTPNGFIGEQAGLGVQPVNQGSGAPNQRDRRRPSDGANSTMPGPAQPGGDLAGQNPAGGQNNGVPPLPGQMPDNGQNPLSANQNNPNGQPIPGLPGQQQFPGQRIFPVPPGTPMQGLQGQQGQQGVPVMQGQQGVPGMPGMPGAAPTAPSTAAGNSFVGGGGSFVGGGGSYVGGGSVTGSQPGNPGGLPAYPGQNPGGLSAYPGQQLPGQPGAPVNSQTGGVSPYPTQPGANGTPPGFPQPGTTAGQGNPAADMIRNILTTPRPGGMPQSSPGTTIGGGIAGVASTAEGEGVKVYNDRSLYQEWEFIYDASKPKAIPNPNATGAGGTPADRMNNNSSPQTPGMGSPMGSPIGSPMGSPLGSPMTSPISRPPGQ
jgi:hypothetical protein